MHTSGPFGGWAIEAAGAAAVAPRTMTVPSTAMTTSRSILQAHLINGQRAAREFRLTVDLVVATMEITTMVEVRRIEPAMAAGDATNVGI